MIDGRRGHEDGSSELDEEEGPAAVTTEEDTPAPEPEATVLSALEPDGTTSGSFVRTLKAIGPRLVRMGVKADHVTFLGILLAGLTGAVIGLGYLYLAIVLLTVGGLMDTLDGAVAKAAGTSSKRGAFFDSVADRVADMFIFGGLAWYFA
ncbi:MAG TPA: CDP-alcohol phosphatidyltransferase family protein, partial [Acidimicrobiales bacterium]|nr:CDP-alcohol phosphatidyltransferase family protein [Acidimicrobiales bacterium]